MSWQNNTHCSCQKFALKIYFDLWLHFRTDNTNISIVDWIASERKIKIGAKCQHSKTQNKEPIKTFVADMNLQKNFSFWMCTRETIQINLTHRKSNKEKMWRKKTSASKECLIECSSGWFFFFVCVSFDEWFQWATFFSLGFVALSHYLCFGFVWTLEMLWFDNL